jgi:hypothetical protein
LFQNNRYDSTSIYNKISFDTINDIIINKSLPIKQQNVELNKIYAELLTICTDIKSMYTSIVKLDKGCPMDDKACSQQTAIKFYATAPKPNENFSLNSKVFPITNYDNNQLLYREEQYKGLYKNILFNMIGNRTSLGFRYVSWYLFNRNKITEDYYYKFAAIDEIYNKSDKFTDILKLTEPGTYNSYSLNLNYIYKVLNNIPATDTEEAELLRMQKESMTPLINYC